MDGAELSQSCANKKFEVGTRGQENISGGGVAVKDGVVKEGSFDIEGVRGLSTK